MSSSLFLGIFCLSAVLCAQMQTSEHFRFRPAEEFDPTAAPLVPDWPEHPEREPISGIVSLRELQHPVSKKALRAAYQAQQFSKAHNLPKAVRKLEQAVRIDPSYRDAHCNLGVLYARMGRFTEARAELRKALDIGPPAAPIYFNLALTSAAAGEYSQAQEFVQKALALDPGNTTFQRVLQLFPH